MFYKLNLNIRGRINFLADSESILFVLAHKIKSDADVQLGVDLEVSAPVRNVQEFRFSSSNIQQNNSVLRNLAIYVFCILTMASQTFSQSRNSRSMLLLTRRHIIFADVTNVGSLTSYLPNVIQNRCPKCCGSHHQYECDLTVTKCAVCSDALT